MGAIKHMIKTIALYVVLLILCGCVNTGPAATESASIETQQKALSFPDHWVTLPQSGSLVIIGVSGRQLKQEAEIETAREDAARKAAMYYGLDITYENMQNIGSGFLDYYVDSNISIDYDQELEKYMDKLVYNPERDITSGEGVLFVRFSYPAGFSEKLDYSFGKNQQGRPEWINRRPQNIGNFIVGVGHSARQLRLKDTIYKSHEAAAAAIVSQLSTSIVASDTSISSAYQNTSVIHRQSKGKLNRFTVIETWINPEGLDVWTLAVAQNADQ